MHLHNVVGQECSNPDYENATFRARQHYKEEHQHNAPYRRSRDFKPILYGAFIGLPNYKHSEPFALLKNVSDLYKENDNIAINFTKSFLRGAFGGSILGYMYFLAAPVGQMEMGKLEAAAGPRAWSGKAWRYVKNVGARYALLGGAATASYTMLTYYFRHHDEANPRPAFFDHTAATTLITMGAAGLYVNNPVNVLFAGFFSLMIISPISWWASNMFKMNALRSPNIFYENSVTREEVERFRQQDAIE